MKTYVSYSTKFLNKGLDLVDMILLTEIENLYKRYPDNCHPSDDYLGRLVQLKRQSTNQRLNTLQKIGWIKIKTINTKTGKLRNIKFNSDFNGGKIDDVKKIKSVYNEKKNRKKNETSNLTQYDGRDIGKNKTQYDGRDIGLEQNTDEKSMTQYAVRNITDGDNNKLYIKEPNTKTIGIVGDYPPSDGRGNPPTGPEIVDQHTGPNEKLEKGNPNEMDLEPVISDQHTGPKNGYSDFLHKGILIDGITYFPMVDEKRQSGMPVSQYLQEKEIGKKIINVIDKHIGERRQQYEKNKKLILELLPHHKDNLSRLDNQDFLNYLNQIRKTLSPGKIQNIQSYTKVIRDYINFIEGEYPVLQQGIRKTISKYTLYPADIKLKNVIK